MLSQEEAIKLAREVLRQEGVSFESREVSVSLEQVYKVVHLLPEGMLGGHYTVIIDANSGDVIGVSLER